MNQSINFNEKPPKGELLITWLGGAGFLLRSDSAITGIDLYLSNSCMRENGAMKRLVPPPARAADLELDYLIVSHDHGDHLDLGSIHELIRPDNKTVLLCPSDTKRKALENGVDPGRIIELNRERTLTFDGMTVRAVCCDHGSSAPDAIGCFVTMADKVVYFLGDSRFRTDFLDYIGPREPIDALLVPINGRFGNPDSRDAAYFTQMLRPKLSIPCHFWLTKEHGGDPGEFASCCAAIAPDIAIAVLAIGETISV